MMKRKAEKHLSRCTKHMKSQDWTNSTREKTASVDEIHSRASSAFAKFREGEGTNYISEAVDLSRQALDCCPPGHHERRRSLRRLAAHLWHRYNCLSRIADIEEAIVCSRRALELCSEDHPLLSTSLDNVAYYLSDRYDQLGKIADLNEAITLWRQAFSLCPSDRQDRSTLLYHIAIYLSRRYKRLGDMMDLNESIFLGRQALELRPSGHPDRSSSLISVGSCLSDRYDRLGDVTDLNEAIILGRKAVRLCPPGHPDRSGSLNNLALCLSNHYKSLGDMLDLNEAIMLGRQALDLRPSGHPNRSSSLGDVAFSLSYRYSRLGDMTDLNEAITLGRQALDLCPSGHPNRSVTLDNVAIYLSYRYNQLGDMKDLDEAIILGRQALDLHPSGHVNRSATLDNVAGYLLHRYKQLGNMSDLDEAITLARQALDICLSGHPDRSVTLNNVALYLSYRYQCLGDMTDLNEAIILGRQALDLRPLGHPLRSSSLDNLALYLSHRYKRLGDTTDLNEAIILGGQALDLRPPGHPLRSSSLDNIALYLSYRYKRLGDMTDLNDAIVLGRQAIDLQQSGHPDRSETLNNLALYYSYRYQLHGDMTDLNEAIILGRQVLVLRPSGQPGRSSSLNNVVLYLFDRYDRLGEITDLNEAVILGREALDLCPPGHSNRSWSLDQLAGCLRARFSQLKELRDRDEIFNLYSELANISQIVSPVDLSAAKQWITVAEDFGHPTTLLAYETSLRLLAQHFGTLPPSPHHLQIFKNLASSIAIDAISACLRNHHAKKGVELLEQGRGVFWNQIARLRSPLEDVIASSQEGEALAREFTRLSSEIQNTIYSRAPDQHNRLCSLVVDLESAITNIRQLPGFARFLLPSSFSELRHAACGGPVVIVNASQYTCDALVVFFDRDPVHIPLQIKKSRAQELSSDLQFLTLKAKSMDIGRDLGRFLRVLWDEVVSPIADFLQTTVPPGSRIWWCPTADFCLLPLHAAGPYRQGQRNFSHLYVSSYTPTLTALIRARRNNPSAMTSIHGKRFLGVGQASAKGESELHFVGSELAVISQRIQGLASFKRLDGPESSMSQVSAELRKSEWVHFACHGIPNRKQPFDSAFGLYDGRFTVERIMGCELENPEFAYLSACHTTVGDEESPDEVIHLASAMQFSGFRSVIGTMWAVDDEQTNKITSKFYENMLDGSGRLDHTRAALALHKTMNSLVGSVSLDQRILYVHIGA